jgi:hypothetical protein
MRKAGNQMEKKKRELEGIQVEVVVSVEAHAMFLLPANSPEAATTMVQKMIDDGEIQVGKPKLTLLRPKDLACPEFKLDDVFIGAVENAPRLFLVGKDAAAENAGGVAN